MVMTIVHKSEEDFHPVYLKEISSCKTLLEILSLDTYSLMSLGVGAYFPYITLYTFL